MTSTEISQRALFTDDELRGIQSWNDLESLFAEKELSLTYAHEVLGSGFELLNTAEKDKLIDVPFVIMDWRFNDGDMGTFVTLTVAAKNPDGSMRKVIVNDGSTGVCQQVETLANRGIKAPVMVKNGLVRSDYKVLQPGKDGEEIEVPATTYYLSESA